jgi:hypothetical protein
VSLPYRCKGEMDVIGISLSAGENVKKQKNSKGKIVLDENEVRRCG